MQGLKLTLAAAAMNFRSLSRRRLNSLVMILSIAGVVTVFSSVLAMNAGLNNAMRDAGRPDRAIVVRAGATAEIASSISREEMSVIENIANVRKANGVPLITGEAVAPLSLVEKRTGRDVNGTLRGVGPGIYAVRPEIKIIEGRTFKPGKLELVVGRQALDQFDGLALGSEVSAYQTKWQVVGIFTSAKSARESELMSDADVVMNVSQRPMFQNVTVMLPTADAFNAFKKTLTSNPGIAMEVLSEPEFLRGESQSLNKLLAFMAYVMGGIMALGAVFVALNAMYSNISDRRREIATLRAIGFAPAVVVSAIVAEAILLALFGGLLGAVLAWLALNGNTMSTAIGSDLHQLVFEITVTVPVVLTGLAAALAIGIIGGLIPAVRSVQSPVVADLRAI